MSEITGTVEAIRRDRYGINVDGKWWNNKFKEVPESVGVGDVVTITYKKDPFWSGIKGGSGKPSAGTATPDRVPKKIWGEVKMSKERCIIRQNAMTSAINIHGTYPIDAEDVDKVLESILDTAKWIESYTSGDAEIAEAERVEKELGLDEAS